MLSQFLVSRELAIEAGAWFFLDDYADGLGAHEEQIADLLVLTLGEDTSGPPAPRHGGRVHVHRAVAACGEAEGVGAPAAYDPALPGRCAPGQMPQMDRDFGWHGCRTCALMGLACR